MANANEPRRRFAPVPIETTFKSVRRAPPPPPLQQQQPGQHHTGPCAELTPEASPRTPPPVPRELGERRRFAPQLIETSRRARRAGDPGPATRPTDKTDITPYTRHIYSSKPRGRRRLDSVNRPDHGDDDRGHHGDEDEDEFMNKDEKDGESSEEEHIRRMPPTRRETEDEGVKEYLLELAAKEADRQLQEAALDAFPNSRAREGGVAHFYFNESSSDGENSSDNATPLEPSGQQQNKARRKSSDQDVGWWQKHMQSHAEHLSRERGDQDEKPAAGKGHEQPQVTDQDKDVDMMTDAELDKMELPVPPDAIWTTTNKVAPEDRRDSMADVGLMRDVHPMARDAEDVKMTDITKAPELPYPTPSSKPQPVAAPDEGLGRSFGAFGMKPDSAHLEKMRKAASPPMLGKDLTFRECPSPKWTKLEPNHSFVQHQKELQNRDTSGEGGLWGGYCVKRGPDGTCLEYDYPKGPRLLATPAVPGTPQEEIGGFDWSSAGGSTDSTSGLSIADQRLRAAALQGQGIPALSVTSLDERLHLERARAEKNEKIAQEFNDEFITQVYNYLSLGYPATASMFDEELSKISHFGQDELKKRDEKELVKGHMLEMKLEGTREEDRCPRWRALKRYIHEWARQHPDLENLDPQHWGVRERRGSWAI